MAVSSSDFNGVDLSTLPAPAVVETLSFEATYAAWLASFQGYCTAAGIDYTAILESDPAIKVLQAGAYRETVMRQRLNDAAHARSRSARRADGCRALHPHPRQPPRRHRRSR